jgi:hypothetical protein
VNGVVALIVALTGLLGALAGIIALFRKVAAVHVLVNSQLKTVMQRVDQLTGVIQGAGLEVPGRLNGEDGPSKSGSLT